MISNDPCFALICKAIDQPGKCQHFRTQHIARFMAGTPVAGSEHQSLALHAARVVSRHF